MGMQMILSLQAICWYRCQIGVKSPALRKKRVPKQCLWGAIGTNSTLFSEGCFFSLLIMFVRKKAPLCIGVLFCVKTALLCR